MNHRLSIRSLAACVAAALSISVAAQDRPGQGRPNDARPATPPTGAAQPGAAGQPPMDPALAKRMAASMNAGTPGLEHQKLVARTGEWDLAVKFWMVPGAPEQASTATATIEPILGGRFLRERVTGEMIGQPFNGEGILGYDNAAKQYVSTWIDSWSTGILESRGTSPDGGKTIEMTGTSTDPESGKPKTSRMVSTMPDGRTMKFESFNQGPDGKEFKSMEIIYTRRGAVGAPPASGRPGSGTGAGGRPPAAPNAPSRPTAPPATR
jgi:hypothetical protein